MAAPVNRAATLSARYPASMVNSGSPPEFAPRTDGSPLVNPGEKAELKVTRSARHAKNFPMPPAEPTAAEPQDRLFERLPETPHVTIPAEATRSVFARTGILPCPAIR